ncbi:MAG: hypothetical protein R2731_06650 [Nocardioides sp.]
MAWPHNGITDGPFARWWASWLLNKEGEEHHRLRRPDEPRVLAQADRWSRARFQALAAGS